ncbi:MAG: preprotein translocase subunit SecG [Pseudobdellovibrio sp.]
MITFLATVHIIACLGLVGLVLIQDSKGGGVFTSQSSSNSVLGATGATSLAQTMTKVMALVFAATCITLSVMSAGKEKSVVDSMPTPPVTPAAAAAAVPTDATKTETAPAAATAAPAAPAQPAANEKK